MVDWFCYCFVYCFCFTLFGVKQTGHASYVMPDWLCNLFSHVWPSIPGKEFNEATDKWLHCLLRGNPEDNSAGESGVYIWRNQPHCRGQGSLDVVTSRCGHCSMNTMVVTQGVSENHPMDYWSIALPTTLSVTTKDWAPQSDI